MRIWEVGGRDSFRLKKWGVAKVIFREVGGRNPPRYRPLRPLVVHISMYFCFFDINPSHDSQKVYAYQTIPAF